MRRPFKSLARAARSSRSLAPPPWLLSPPRSPRTAPPRTSRTRPGGPSPRRRPPPQTPPRRPPSLAPPCPCACVPPWAWTRRRTSSRSSR
eukprot:31414-Pelagococcus_subviridis.AAC.6